METSDAYSDVSLGIGDISARYLRLPSNDESEEWVPQHAKYLFKNRS